MTTFKDSKNREWKFTLTIGKAKAVLGKTGVNLLEPENGDPSLVSILTDEFKIGEIICILLESEFAAKGLDPANMLDEEWDGATSQNAYSALLRELSDFFVARGQLARSEIIKKTQEAVVVAMEIMSEEVAKLNPAERVREEVAKQSAGGSTSGKPPAEPDSTPTD